MFSEGGILMVAGILLGLAVIGGSVYYVNKMFADNTQEILVRFILLIFTALVAGNISKIHPVNIYCISCTIYSR